MCISIKSEHRTRAIRIYEKNKFEIYVRKGYWGSFLPNSLKNFILRTEEPSKHNIRVQPVIKHPNFSVNWFLYYLEIVFDLKMTWFSNYSYFSRFLERFQRKFTRDLRFSRFQMHWKLIKKRIKTCNESTIQFSWLFYGAYIIWTIRYPN